MKKIQKIKRHGDEKIKLGVIIRLRFQSFDIFLRKSLQFSF